MILNLLEKCEGNDYSNPKVFMFETNAKNFKINYKLINIISGNFPHVGITAREGICVLYFSPQEKIWLNVDVYTRKESVNVLMTHMINEGETYQIMIYGPILSELSELKVEIDNQYDSKIIQPLDSNRNVGFFGGIHSFGIGCTTVGTMFSNILGRKQNLNTHQITFNDRNYLEHIYNFFKSSENIPYFDICILELDYYNQDDEIVEKYLKDVVTLIKAHCDVLIGWFVISPKKEYKYENIDKILYEEISNGDIIIENYSWLYDEEYYDMCTFGYHFINDTGNIMIFKRLQIRLEEL